MARRFTLQALWICVCLPLAGASTSSFSAMFFLGASMLDVGTNYYVANSTSRSVSPPYAPGRFSNGLIISDFLEKLAGLPPIPPFLRPAANLSHGANFASSGSGLLDDTGKAFKVVPFSTQLAQFKNLTGKLAKYDLPSSVVVINIGTNDLQAHVSEDWTLDFIRMLTNKLKDSLKDMYHLGVRKILVIGISPLGCTPTYRLRSTDRISCWERLNGMVNVYNDMVQASLSELRRELLGLRLIYFDAFGFTQDMIYNGPKYGFRVVAENCCGGGELNATLRCGVKFVCKDPRSYLYWDYHPTEKALGFISKAIWTGRYPLVKPVNLKSLARTST